MFYHLVRHGNGVIFVQSNIKTFFGMFLCHTQMRRC